MTDDDDLPDQSGPDITEWMRRLEADPAKALNDFSDELAAVDASYREWVVATLAMIVATAATLADDAAERRVLLNDERWGENRPKANDLILAVARRVFKAWKTTHYGYKRAWRFSSIGKKLNQSGIVPTDFPKHCKGKTLQQLLGDFPEPGMEPSDGEPAAQGGGLGGVARTSHDVGDNVIGGAAGADDDQVDDQQHNKDEEEDGGENGTDGDAELARGTAPRFKPPAPAEGPQPTKRFPFSQEREVALEFNGHRDPLWAVEVDEEFELRGKRAGDHHHGHRRFQIVNARRAIKSPGRWFVNLDHDVAIEVGQHLQALRQGEKEMLFYFRRRSVEAGVTLLELRMATKP